MRLVYLKIESWKRWKIFEEISGFLGAAAHLFFDETVDFDFDPRVAVVVVDVRQCVDDFGVGIG